MAARSRTTRASASIVCPTGAHGDMPIQTGSMTLAFLEPGLVAIGESTAVKTSIDAQLSAHSITSNNEMMELVTDIGQGNNAWAVGRFDVLAAQAKLPEQVSSRLPPDQVVRRGRACQRRLVRQRSAPKRATSRLPRTSATSSAAFLGLARMQAQADPRTHGHSSNRCS